MKGIEVMSNICFVVPTYPLHYLYALNLLKSYNLYQFERQADLFFVFTNEQERDGFLECNSLVLPLKLRGKKKKGIINIKKFYALMQLKDQYDYIIVLDDDCLFIDTVDLSYVCNSFYKRKELYGNLIENEPWDYMGKVADNCKKFFSKEINCPLYLWWNQMAIYKTDILSDFFQVTKIDKKISMLKWEDFDYYIYMYYLLLFQGFCVVDIGIIADCAFTEITGESTYRVLSPKSTKKSFYMATEYVKKTFDLNSIFISCHVDRGIKRNKIGRGKETIRAIQTIYKLQRYLS